MKLILVLLVVSVCQVGASTVTHNKISMGSGSVELTGDSGTLAINADLTSFTGTLELPGYDGIAGVLKIDSAGKVFVDPGYVVSNAEYASIFQKWTNENTDPTRQVLKIYLPNGVPVGGFDHTIHTCILVGTAPVSGTIFAQRTKFVGYIEADGVARTSISNEDLPEANVLNANEIYGGSSQAHPNNTQNPNEKQHIINHFISDWNQAHYQQNHHNKQIVSIAKIAVLSGDVGNWDHTKQFFAGFDIGGAISKQSGVFTLYGSQNGFSVQLASGGYSVIPTGFTEIY